MKMCCLEGGSEGREGGGEGGENQLNQLEFSFLVTCVRTSRVGRAARQRRGQWPIATRERENHGSQYVTSRQSGRHLPA